MKKALFFSFLLVCQCIYSQDVRIIGAIIDSTLKRGLKDVSVVLLNKKDSIIISDVRSDSNGKFLFPHVIDPANTFLFISFPGYVSIAKELQISDFPDKIFDIGNIYLTSQAVLLTEVIVKANVKSIQVRGDTLQYATSQIKLPPNTTVEDLLKILPGLQVDPSGKITAQGKKVKKVLVDGEEFFSDDPVFVTRNLRSEMIANVQVYDQKSDAAIFTGIDDGIRDKVINLKLKQDKSNGVFGKIEIGSGNAVQIKPYKVQSLMNAFKGKQKLSGYFSSNNIGQFGLGSTEKNQLGVTNEMEQYDGKGLPQYSAGGIHYDNKWNKDRNSINADYHYSISNITGFDSSFANTILPSGSILRLSNNHFEREGYTHKANVTYKQQVGKLTNFSLNTVGALTKGSAGQRYSASDLDGNQQFLNRIDNQVSFNQEGRRMKSAFLIQQKFNKPGRTVSFSLDYSFDNADERQTQLSNTEYFNGKPIIDSIRNLNLFRSSDHVLQNLALGISFSEKLNKAMAVVLSMNSVLEDVTDQYLSRGFNNPLAPIDPSFSTSRDDSRKLYSGNLSLSYNKGKVRTSVGGTMGTNRVFINDLLNGTIFRKNFEVWKPFGRLQYAINDNSGLGFSYRGSTTGPGYQDISPYAFNNGQLIRYFNNLHIRNSFSNRFTLNYESFRSISKAFTAIVANYTSHHDPIKMILTIDGSGAYQVRYDNIRGFSDREIEITGFYSRPIEALKTQFTLDVSGKAGNNYSYINAALNQLRYATSSFGILLSKSKSGKYDTQLGGTLYYDVNHLTEGAKKTTNNFVSYKLKYALDYYFSEKFQFHSDAEFLRQGKNAIFVNNFNRLIWNVWFSKSFFSNNQLTVKLSINDLLNSNAGFSRSASPTFFSENRYLTIQRYFMLTAAWNFTKYKMLKQ